MQTFVRMIGLFVSCSLFRKEGVNDGRFTPSHDCLDARVTMKIIIGRVSLRDVN